jgi:ABC-type transport system involved in multi-copper enzyme maturation permease subunit
MRATVARATLRELAGRKVLLWGVVLSSVFLGIYLTGLVLIRRQLDAGGPVTFVGTMLAILALYIVSFLGAFLALVLAVGSVSSEIDAGTIHAVLARPMRRSAWLWQRWAALATLVSGYTVVMGAAAMTLASIVMGYRPGSPWATLALMALQSVVMVTLGTMLSTRTSTVPGGVALFALFGLAWLAGILEFIGNGIGNQGLVNTGIAVSLVMPTDALWKGASYYASTPDFIARALGQAGLPFSSTTPPAAAFILWSIAYLGVVLAVAHRALARRDL